jgi:hypothetical protein
MCEEYNGREEIAHLGVEQERRLKSLAGLIYSCEGARRRSQSATLFQRSWPEAAPPHPGAAAATAMPIDVQRPTFWREEEPQWRHTMKEESVRCEEEAARQWQFWHEEAEGGGWFGEAMGRLKTVKEDVQGEGGWFGGGEAGAD